MPNSPRATEMHSDEAVAPIRLPLTLCLQVNAGNISTVSLLVTKSTDYEISTDVIFSLKYIQSMIKACRNKRWELKLFKTDL